MKLVRTYCFLLKVYCTVYRWYGTGKIILLHIERQITIWNDLVCVCIQVCAWVRLPLIYHSLSPTLAANHFSCNDSQNKLFRRTWNLTLVHTPTPAVIPLKYVPPPTALSHFPSPHNPPLQPNYLFKIITSAYSPSPQPYPVITSCTPELKKTSAFVHFKIWRVLFSLTVMYCCNHPHRDGLMCT